MLTLTGNRPRPDTPAFEPSAWLAAAALGLTWRHLRHRDSGRGWVALAGLGLALAPTWAVFRLGGLAQPLSPLWAIPAALGLAWLWWIDRERWPDPA